MLLDEEGSRKLCLSLGAWCDLQQDPARFQGLATIVFVVKSGSGTGQILTWPV